MQLPRTPALFLIIIASWSLAGAQTDAPLILPTGISKGNPEELLPQNAVVHIRAHNLDNLLTALDELIMTFVPEKAVPPQLQPMLENSQPALAYLGLTTLGRTVTTKDLSALLGIELDQPVSLTFYPENIKSGFIFNSIP